jgi:hypothetical protein
MATFPPEKVVKNEGRRRENILHSLNEIFIFCAVRYVTSSSSDPAYRTLISLAGHRTRGFASRMSN